jgi:putative endonuclease
MAYCYLLCFTNPIGNPNSRHGQACHYLGFTTGTLTKRLQQHKDGNGSKITKAAVCQYNRELKLVYYWRNGSRDLERELKRRHCPRFYCPFCNR